MILPATTRGTVSVPGGVFIELVGVAARRGAFHSVLLAEVVALAGQAPGLSEEQVLVGLVRVAERAVRVLGGGSSR